MAEHPPEHVLVLVAQPAGDGLGVAGGEALGAGRELASRLDLPLACAVIGSAVEGAATDAQERGARLVLVADAVHLARFSGDVVVPLAAEAVRLSGARTVLLARGPDALELAPRLASRLAGASVMGVTEFRPGENGDLEVVATVFGGAARAVYRFGAPGPRVLGLAAAVADAPPREAGRSAELRRIDAPPPDAERVRVVQPAAGVQGPRLEDARVVVAGGRGLQKSEHYSLVRELASALGGLPGASRAIVDDGWAPPSEQVGLTGALVAPDLYLAAGISGASQHMAGCSNARVIVAVNNDPQAPIFKYAHFGIVDDCREVLPELIRLSRKTATRG